MSQALELQHNKLYNNPDQMPAHDGAHSLVRTKGCVMSKKHLADHILI